MKTRFAALLSFLLLSAIFFISGRGESKARPSDLRDAPGDKSALDSLGTKKGSGPISADDIDARFAPPAEQPQSAAVPASGTAPAHGPTPEQAREMLQHNKGLFKTFSKSPGADRPVKVKFRPFADYEKTGFLIMSSLFTFNSQHAKLEMAKILPPEATLVIFTDTPTQQEKQAILGVYGAVLPAERIKVVTLPGADGGFWARDGIPVPMFGEGGRLTVIDAAYYHRFEADKEVSQLFNAALEKHKYYFEGGNFQASRNGDCVIVNNDRHAQIPDQVFSAYYGCKQLIRLPFVDGIGHVDERVRFINDTTLVTDTPAYKDILTGKGFTVHMLPRPKAAFGTYVNSLIMDGKVVIPVFGESTDAQALAVYEGLGLKAFGGDSSTLSPKGQGSVHCITMTYPKVPVAELLKSIKAKEF
ncbi:MAG: hypothetical protein A3J79_06395 [Elusimicrobia bacterium RIFOXYB2_FULL_62_6]|nr:MAG: hypothetical protein A3J79_06395 [Elusimicrobia bacterium RIFOXYB2_FULL_62_6]